MRREVKAGDLIFWHGYSTIVLVVRVECDRFCLLQTTGMITHDSLEDGYTIIDEHWNWPIWHINHRCNR